MRRIRPIILLSGLLAGCTTTGELDRFFKQQIAAAESPEEASRLVHEHQYYRRLELRTLTSSIVVSDGIDSFEAWCIAAAYREQMIGPCTEQRTIHLGERGWVVFLHRGREAELQGPMIVNAKTGAISCEGLPDVNDPIALVHAYEARFNQQSSYLPLPDSLTSLEPSDAAHLFVVEVRPAFAEPTGYRFEFYADPREAFLTTFDRHGKIDRNRLPPQEAERIWRVCTTFDWRQIEDPVEDGVIVMIPDDVGIEIRARLGSSRHEATIGISRSGSLRKLLTDLGVLE